MLFPFIQVVNANVVQDPSKVVVDVSGQTFRVLKEELRLCPWVTSPSVDPSAPQDNTQSESPALVAEGAPRETPPADDSHGPNAHLVDRSQEPLGCIRLSANSSVVCICQLACVVCGYGYRL